MKKKHILKKYTAMAVSCVLMAMSVPAVPFSASAEGNIITNSTFDTGTTDWGLYKESGGVASLTTEDGRLALKVTNQGKLNYAVQMYYDIVPLYQNGVYRLKFDISASVPRYVEAMIQQNGGTYQAYTWQGIDVTTEPQTVDYEFTMEEETDIMAKFCFNCGLEKQDGELPEHTIYLDNVSLELVDDSNVDYGEIKGDENDININQVGYRTNAKKTAVIRNAEAVDTNEFAVCNADTDEVVYTGTVIEVKNNTQADETNYIADFSDLTTSGRYYVIYGDLEKSYTFEIGDDVYNNLLDSTVRMLYLQRCGTEIEDEKFSHPSCHDTIATIYGTDEKIEVSGGWHDAGDYGRYVVAGAKAVADLMYAYLANPSMYSDNINIPESGNGTPDILDEVRYELEWMMKMQDKTDGGVYHKVTCDVFPGYVMPEKETRPLIVMPKATPATADFAASMALAYEVYKDIDHDFADTCLESAKKAYEWAKANPNELYLANPADISTGAYEDKNARDEIYWASVQLYRATGDESYISGVTSAMTGLDWSTVGDYGNIAILTMDGIDKESSLYQNALKAVQKQANDFVNISKVMSYGVTITKFNWGSNMTIANSGIILGLAYQLTGDENYLNTANTQLDYLLGTNPLGTSFVSGFGTVSPQNPHHRPSMAVGSAMPGMLAGGVNQNLEDSAAKAYCQDSAPAKRWVDNAESYSTNEITIYWNSPLTYLLSITGDDNSDDSDILYGDANEDGVVDIADAAAIIQSLGNKDKYALYEQGAKNADCYNTGDGVTGMDALAIQMLKAGMIDSLPVTELAE
ncbi:MAG: glycoside hydrolase family 9 protein [Ruminococcus flavefaciens]|nr:glycoside hydrolase family 9 protein [Ruminococcus flavefaciens]MCM1229353.1 glycoside hydrolase family 9 protein [Ruminococcus flavefaciens]